MIANNNSQKTAQNKINEYFATFGLLGSIERLNTLLTDSLTLYSSEGYNTDEKETQNNVYFVNATVELLVSIAQAKE